MNLGSQHLHARKRLFKYLEPFPARTFFKKGLDYVMYAVGLVQWVALVPQVLAVYGPDGGAGVSVTTFILLTFFNVLWALYGAVHREKPILISNVLQVVLDLIIIYGIVR